MHLVRWTLGFAGACLATAGIALAGELEWNPRALSEADRTRYELVHGALDAWSPRNGIPAFLEGAIDEFIAAHPTFLPMRIESARLAIMRGRLHGFDWRDQNDLALAILEPIMASAPNHPAAFVLAGHAYTNLDRLDEAERVLVHAASIPEADADPWLHNHVGWVHYRRGRFEQARVAIEKAVVRSLVDDLAMITAIGELQAVTMKLGRSPVSNELVDAIFAVVRSPRDRIRLAVKLADMNDEDANRIGLAIRLLTRQCDATPDLTDCRITLGETVIRYSMLRRDRGITLYDPDAAAVAEKLLEPHRRETEFRDRIYPWLCRIAMSRGDFPAARAWISEAREHGMGVGIWGPLEAEIRNAEGDLRGAIAIGMKAAERDPAKIMDGGLVRALWALNDPEAWERYHRRVIELNPNEATAYGNYANYLLRERGDAAGAIEAGRKALDISPYSAARAVTAAAYRLLAAERLVAGEREKARALFRAGRKIWPETSDFYATPAYCHALCAEVAELVADFERSAGPAAPIP